MGEIGEMMFRVAVILASIALVHGAAHLVAAFPTMNTTMNTTMVDAVVPLMAAGGSGTGSEEASGMTSAEAAAPVEELSVCPYAKDNKCFDGWLYTCERCCTTGMNLQGGSCWDAAFTNERCCKAVNEIVVTQAALTTDCPYEVLNLATPMSHIEGARCFDWLYPCEQCCTTDKS